MKKCTKCYEEKSITLFSKRNGVGDGFSAWCKQCHSEYAREKYKNSEKERDRKKRNKLKIIETNKEFIADYLSKNPCVDCGESNIITLDFDYLGQKSYNVSEMFNLSRQTIINEIAKCEVRCANCHRIKTAKQFGYWRDKVLR